MKLSAIRLRPERGADDAERNETDRREAMLLLPAAAFMLVNAAAFSLVEAGVLRWPHFRAVLVWAALMVTAHFLLRRFRPQRDPFLLPIVALLTGWGLLLIDRLAVNFLARQTLWLTLSMLLAIGIAVLPRSLRPLQRYRYLLLLSGLLLMVLTFIAGVNPSGAGAALWLPVPLPFVGVAYFQPSELLKLLMVIFLASYFAEKEPMLQAKAPAPESVERRPLHRRLLGTLPFLGPLLLMWGFCMLLLIWQRDLGAATLFFILFLTLLYLATGERLYVIGGLALLAVAGVFGYFAFEDIAATRIDTWWNPWPEASDRAYQIVQSLYALASGGVAGQGIGQGFPDYIPVVHSDFAFAAIAEEWGLIGSLTVVACFALLAHRGLRIALLFARPPAVRPFQSYLAAGVSVVFSAQALLIMGGVTKLLPLTGITLPFISYGGSSLLISCAMAGLLLHLSAAAEDRWLLS